MAVSDELLAILCCPVTRVPLERVSEARLAELNDAVRAGRLRHADGTAVAEPLDEALATVDGKRCYRVDGGIPVLLPESGMGVG